MTSHRIRTHGTNAGLLVAGIFFRAGIRPNALQRFDPMEDWR